MVLNPDLNAMLDHSVKVLRPTESVVRGITTMTFSSTIVGTVSGHVQPLTPVEAQKEWGTEVRGDHQLFVNSTVAVVVGDLIKQVTGPYLSGTKWWLRAIHKYNTKGGQHTRALLEITEESTS